MDAWTLGLGIVTLGSLSYVSTGYKNAELQHTFRINIGNDDSFLGDLRFIGAVVGLGLSMVPALGKYRGSIRSVAGISALSLASTEGIRYGLGQQGSVAPKEFEAMPDWKAMWPSKEPAAVGYGTRSWQQAS
jgi:hypothetical protein